MRPPPASTRKRALLLIAPLVVIAGALLALAAAGLEILSAGRAYVAGEGLWSKSQKDAVHHLQRYARSRDGQDYRSYLEAIAVPLGDRKARLALDRPDPDYAAARQGFLEGRNHPDDVAAMARLFVRFRDVSTISKAVDIWAEGDERIERLRAAAAQLHEEIAGRRDPVRLNALLAEIDEVNAQLAPLEDAFSSTLGEATRWLRGVLINTLIVAAVLLVAAALAAMHRTLRRTQAAEDALRASEERLRQAAGRLRHDAERFEFLAHHDALTGLPNRAMFEERARQALAHARRRGKTAALLFLDLDDFKRVNYSLGHEVGDSLLKVIAARLKTCVRGEDFMARIGGDEFCVLLQEIGDPREAAAVAQKLLYELGKEYRLDDRRVSCGASVGIACVPQDGDDAMTLLKHADAAMYRAKERGRNGYQFFSANMNREAAAAAALADELRDGLARGELFLEYQPRVDNATGLAVGAEALARWRHPRMGVLAPEAFLPLSDESGLAAPLGAWMLREACAQARRWHDAGAAQFAVAVNVSARQLRHGGLAEGVSAALDSSRLPGTALLIEVPESALRQVPGTLEDALAALAATGARLAVDKFGTGYASVPLLKRLRVDTVCIDPKLTAGVPGDRERSALTRALIALARGLNLEVVAKGVESAAQREFLVDAGCRVGQGSLYAAPRPAQDIEPLLAAQRAA